MANRLINDLYPSMPWDEIDAVVFDIGKVLVTIDEEAVLKAMFPDDGELRARVRLHTTQSPYWVMLDAGTLTMDECVKAMAGKDTALLEPIRRFVTGWPDYRYVIEEGKQAVLTCKAHGKKLYLLTNYAYEHFQRNMREYDFFSLFDGAVVSSIEHQLKPKPDIYNTLTQRYGLNPKRTLFIDDTPANIEGAFAAGWHGFCMNEPGMLAAFLGQSSERKE